MAAILSAQQVTGLLTVTTEATAHTRTIRPYRGQPAREEITYDLALTTTRNREAITAAEARLGWRVYATNRPADQLSMSQAVLAYREEYLIEHSQGRLKGAPLSLRPVYLSRDDHTTGLIRLLTIGVRVLTVLEYAIRQRLTDTHARVSRPVCQPAESHRPPHHRACPGGVPQPDPDGDPSARADYPPSYALVGVATTVVGAGGS